MSTFLILSLINTGIFGLLETKSAATPKPTVTVDPTFTPLIKLV